MPTRGLRSLAFLAVLLPLPLLASGQDQAPATPAAAPPADTPAQTAPPRLELDSEALLASPKVLPDQAGDAVWALTPSQGRRILMLPLNVQPGEQAGTLTDPGIEIRGGRYLMWHISPEERSDPGQPAAPTNPATPHRGRGVRDLLLMEQNGNAAGRVPQAASIEQARPVGEGLPASAPTFTRSITVEPNGTIRWQLDRAIPGAAVQEQENDYTLKLRGDRLRAKEPARPQLNRDAGGNPREAAQRRREEEAQYRLQRQEFQAIVDRVRSAPETFEVPLPERIYAVYEVSAALPNLTLGGPAPLPWSVSLDQLAALRNLAGQGTGGAQPSDYATLAVMVRDQHPLTHRLVAEALHRAGVIGQSQLNDPLYQVLKAIATGPHDEARRIVLADLVTTVPPTPASVQLLREAAQHLTPEMQLAALRGMLQGNASDPAQQREMIATLNRTLADEGGPEAGVALRALVDQVGRIDPSQATLGSPLAALITGVDFEKLPPRRKDQAIAYVIRDAGTEPLAAAWLNHRLLSSPDQALVRQTLELLSRATLGTGTVEPLTRALLGLVFGEPPAADEAPRLDLRLSGPIPLGSTSHGLFRGLQHGDPQVRELAWRAVGHFKAADGAPTEASEEVIAQILRAGLGQDPTPQSLATFLDNHPQSPVATGGLVQLVLYSNHPPTARHAARSLLGSARESLPEAITSLEPSQRADFALNLYLSLKGLAPLALDLLAEPTATEPARSFGAALAAGELPDPAAIAQLFGSETELLNLATSPDSRVAAGAVGGLVAMAGGDEDTAGGVADKFARLPDRSLGNLTAEWGSAKRDIYARRLAELAGSYRVTVRYEPMPFDRDEYGAPPPGGMPAAMTPRSVTVGVVELNVEGADAFLGNRTVSFTVPEERLSLRLASATDLANFPNPELGEMSLDRLQAPIDLLPQEDGSWRGEGQTSEGGTITVLLEPVRQ